MIHTSRLKVLRMFTLASIATVRTIVNFGMADVDISEDQDMAKPLMCQSRSLRIKMSITPTCMRI